MEISLITVGLALALLAILNSADSLIHHAILLSVRLKCSAFIVGGLVVGCGTSAPEAVVSFFSGLDLRPNLSVGNAIGSNLVNTALLALTLCIYPILHSSIFARISFAVLAGLLLTMYLVIDRPVFEFSDSLFLFSGGLLFIVLMLIVNRRMFPANAPVVEPSPAGSSATLADPTPANNNFDLEPTDLQLSHWQIGLRIGLSLGLLLLSAHLFVELAILFCQSIGISDLFIGLTVVAIGTSIPEVSASLRAAKRGATDISLGNMLGSMIFNLSVVFSFAVIRQDATLEPEFFDRDYYGLVISFLLVFAMYLLGRRSVFLRIISVGAIALYLLYVLIVLQSQFA